MAKEVGQTITQVIVAVVVIVVLIFGFLVKQDCDTIDKQFLYCRLHPFTGFDLVGMIIFLAAALHVGNFLPEKLYFSESKGTTINVVAGFIGLLVGALIMWNL